ncbi:hypothetical protein [Agrobacterium vitis]|nr:hypothetical protein [Agrobacterium vitis]NSY13057.1 hypothetical protein [Agrobacterium vitis]NSY22814.1 hypothetical protein [Agrobacterium vitis]NTA22518.1 hypothetical protein [Agrobacterium vitis]WEO70785.1 hypothetical protein G6L01_012395 [Agrobacterium vitis]
MTTASATPATHTPASTTARIEVFRPGTFTPMEGASITYSAADLKAAADAYDPDTAPVPVVVGHPATDAPAYGWAQSFDYDASSQRLYATVGEIDPAFSEAVKAGRYKKVSLSFFRPEASANPVPGTWYPRHIGFLGGAAPAVSGLKNVQFSAPEGSVTVSADFGERGFEEAASLFRSIREFVIEKFGMEDADKALPGFQIDWLSETEIQPPASRPAFAAPLAPQPPEKKEPVVVQTNADFAAREADFAAREARLKESEAKIAHAENVSFAEGLVTDCKLLPALKDKLVAVLNAVPGETTVSFAAGEAAVPVAQALRDLLAAQPKIVSFGAMDMPETGVDESAASFAADGKPVDQAGLERHNKAMAYQRQHPGTSYMDAVRAVG